VRGIQYQTVPSAYPTTTERSPPGARLARGGQVRLRFDRGTVLLLESPREANASDLPGVLWDPRVGALRAPAMLHAAIRAELTRRGVHVADELAHPVDLPGRWTDPPLRPYQDDALWAWQRAGRRGVVVLPTGAGKTRVALAALARFGRPAVALVPTRVLLEQWTREIAAVYSGPVGVLGDGQRRLEAVTVSTFESAWRHMHEIGDRFELIVVDEVHHFGDGRRDEALELCAAPFRLGLTATPPRRPASERTIELVGPTVFELAVADLSGRFLAPFQLVILRLDLAPDERREWEQAVATYRPALRAFQRECPGADWLDFARAASRTEQGRQALTAFRRSRTLLAFPSAKRDAVAGLLDRHASSRVLIFTADNATAYAVARQHLVMPITCDISKVERAAALDRFRAGELRALVSARVLNEGIDVPDADVAIVVGGTHGEREHVQRIGRLLRPREGKTAIVYELVMRGTSEVSQARRRRAGLGPREPRLL
jgi:superfamily II DNA or RNA helicase